jgi:hypothetical protein
VSWQLTTDVETYAAAVTPLLGADPVRHTVALTVVENARAHPTPGEIFGWWTDPSGAVTGALSHTPPYALALGALPEPAVLPAVALLTDGSIAATGVVGAMTASVHLGAAWAAATRRAPRLRFAQRLYRLAALVEPSPGPAGRARPAGPSDVGLLADWSQAFSAEVGTIAHPDPHSFVADRLAYGGWTVWQDAGGRVVAMAGRSRPAAGAVRIGPVYTPPERRQQGFAAAVTAAATGAPPGGGAPAGGVVPHQANPVTNALYGKLGYTGVEDRLELDLPPTS